jgi:hypothetical protein
MQGRGPAQWQVCAEHQSAKKQRSTAAAGERQPDPLVGAGAQCRTLQLDLHTISTKGPLLPVVRQREPQRLDRVQAEGWVGGHAGVPCGTKACLEGARVIKFRMNKRPRGTRRGLQLLPHERYRQYSTEK